MSEEVEEGLGVHLRDEDDCAARGNECAGKAGFDEWEEGRCEKKVAG